MLETMVKNMIDTVHKTQGIYGKGNVKIVDKSKFHRVPVYISIKKHNGTVVKMKSGDALFYRALGIVLENA